MTKKDLISIRVDRRELDLIREGVTRVVKDREFTIKVQPVSAERAVAATDTLVVVRALQAQLDDLV
jgi:hypothetical protein